MEVVSPMTEDFNFSTTLLSYTSAPSSPRPFGNPSHYLNYYASAPASPSRRSAADDKDLFFDHEDKNHHANSSPIAESFDFGLGFSGPLDSKGSSSSIAPLATADELFEGGKIRPLKPPPRHSVSNDCQGSREFCNVSKCADEVNRDRGRGLFCSSSHQSRRVSRSLSPLRSVPEHFGHCSNPCEPADFVPGGVDANASKKWRLKDLFLFRSASEGRKDALLKYTLLSYSSSSSSSSSLSSSFILRPFFNRKKAVSEEEEQGHSTLPAEKESGPSLLSSKRGSGRRMSVHEMHYAAGRAAVMEEMKKKTPLAYHHNSMFSCIRFNPAATHTISRASSRSSFSRN